MKHMKLKKNLLNRSRGGNFLVYLLLVLAGVFMALPLVYAIASSLKPFEEIVLFPPKLYVINPTLENFESLFTLSQDSEVPFTRYLFNSLFIAVASTVLQIIIASMAA